LTLGKTVRSLGLSVASVNSGEMPPWNSAFPYRELIESHYEKKVFMSKQSKAKQSKTKNWDWKVRLTVILMCCKLYVLYRQGQHFARDNRNGRTIQLGSSNLRHSTFVLLCWLFAYAGNGWIFGRLFRRKNSLRSGDPALVGFYYRHSLGRVIWNAWIASRSRLYGLGEAVTFSYSYIAWS
jgi:hypothetical protein